MTWSLPALPAPPALCPSLVLLQPHRPVSTLHTLVPLLAKAFVCAVSPLLEVPPSLPTSPVNAYTHQLKH